MALTLWVQRTGEVSWSRRFSRMRAGSVSGLAETGGSEDFGGAYGLGKLFTGRLHEGGVEGAAHRKGQGAFGSRFFQGGAGSGNCPGLTGYDDLAVGIVVGRDHYAGNLTAYSLDRPVVEPDDGSHGAGLHLTAALHCACAGGHQTEAILKRHSTGGHEGAEFAQRVTADHIGKRETAASGQYDRMQQDGRLGHPGRSQILIRAFKHYVRDTEAEDFIGPLHHFSGLGRTVVQLFAHARKLGALPRKNKCSLHSAQN